ncbi:PAS domain S-box protein [Halovenus sp. WSH3]|uniref:histidine kinase n=1 Tax=Halovenus carboxidivorans TaxID=2692199 RepID=A0A6B0SXX9_9EURY|nr:PAS domain S-box protein [Halovenus carboxidivorans]MXR50598.1 PAS domain S-box protein [Halovenus carboxidivorans]
MSAESGGISVLCVESEPDRADRTVRLLEAADDRLTVTAVCSAQSALEYLDADGIDCVLSAYALPEIDGLQFLQTVRAEYPNLPFILYTTAASEDIVSAAVSADVSDHLDRPQQPDGYQNLAARIRAVVERERVRRGAASDHEQAKRVLEASPDGILVSVERELVYANPAAADLFGAAESDLLGADPVSLTDTDPVIWEPKRAQADDELLTRHRSSFPTLDGGRVDTELTTNTIEWQSGTGIVAVLRDVTESADTERNVDQTRTYLEGIVNSVSALISLKDTEGRYLLMNRRCRELLGIDESTNVVGMTDDQLFDEQLADKLSVDESDLFETGETSESEVTVPTTEGERTLLIRKTPLFDDGDPYAICAVATDITTQKNRQHALTERVKELSAVHRVVDMFNAERERNEDLLSEFITGLPESFQYPSRTDARITYGDRTVTTGEFDPDCPVIDAVGRTQKGPDLYLEVACRPPDGESDPFLAEERSLLDTLASVIAGYLERRSYIEELQRYETTLRALGDPVYALDADGRFTFVNDALLDRTGYDKSEILGEHASLLLTEEGVERGSAVIRDLLDSPEETQTAKWEMELKTADGERIPAENHVALLPFGEDGFRGTAGVIRDITDRTERERELRRRKDLLVRTERMADVGGWELDLEAGQIYWTEGARLIHDVSEEFEPTPDKAIEFFHPEDRERINRAVARCRETGEPFDAEVRLITAEGRERLIHIRGEAVSENGTETVRGTLQDITELRENEQQLTVLNRVLRHNLRNSLNVVTANAELLVDQLQQFRSAVDEPNEPTEAALREAVSAFPFAEALDNLEQIETKAWELLAIADKSRELGEVIGQIDHTGRLDIGDLLSSLVQEYRQQYPEATINLDAASVSVEASAESVSLALEELLENALKHAGSAPVVDIAVRQPSESRVEITIKDDGPGIPDIERQALEEGEETALKHSSGFGLWTVNWLLGRLGGAVALDETEPGTLVRVELPAA